VLLTLDRGNTSLRAMLHGPVPQRFKARADAPAAVLSALASLSPPPERAVGSTVVAGGLDAAAAVLAARGVSLELAGRDLPCPLPLAYDDPHTLGTDRWLCALAGFGEHGAAVVVQCGTAITVDAVAADGSFLGGAIAPGLAAMASGLALAAPALPRPVPLQHAVVPARSSLACVEAGTLLSFCGAVERLVGEAAAALPAGVPRLLTGGDAETYLRHGRLALVHEPDLLHRGLRRLASWRPPSS